MTTQCKQNETISCEEKGKEETGENCKCFEKVLSSQMKHLETKSFFDTEYDCENYIACVTSEEKRVFLDDDEETFFLIQAGHEMVTSCQEEIGFAFRIQCFETLGETNGSERDEKLFKICTQFLCHHHHLHPLIFQSKKQTLSVQVSHTNAHTFCHVFSLSFASSHPNFAYHLLLFRSRLDFREYEQIFT